ncbi:MAG TPA: PQQ-dependent sugar dehydrogenase [Nitrosopumilaceae archaeon]|nr:PQQ-dependent sugar dehydrogenase [Nitrosopumilaceae archaeon]
MYKINSDFQILLVFFIGIGFSYSYDSAYGQEFENYNVKVITVAENLEIPWEIAFAPDDRIFFTERVGKLRVIENGQLVQKPIATINVGTVEGGLLGLALDPSFEENHFIYLYYTYVEFPYTYNKVVRFTEKNNSLADEFIVVDKIPGAAVHDGGRLKFGPDEKLYITTGDAGNSNSAQDLNSLAGKILRINPDGTIPFDNPFEDSMIFSYGHRNPQGLDWDPVTGKLIATEHGPTGERGFAHDEINVVESGKNYGWPKVIGGESDPNFVNPIIHTGDNTWAPSGATFYDSKNIPEWTNKYFVATLRGNHLRMLDLNIEENKVVSSEALFSNSFGRLRDASMGPDGNLYLLTSNRDGRGSPAENDDRILKIIPIISEEKIKGDSSMPPLKQVKTGINPTDVACKTGFTLILKHSTGNPACVFGSSASKLVSIGWGILP